MEADGFAELVLDVLYRRPCGDASGQVRYVAGVVSGRFLDDNRIAHQCFSLRPACFRTLLSVPGARSSDGFPATVTRPDFVGCLNWRWLPRVATRYQPSCSINLIASLTFMSHPGQGH